MIGAQRGAYLRGRSAQAAEIVCRCSSRSPGRPWWLYLAGDGGTSRHGCAGCKPGTAMTRLVASAGV